MADWQSVAVERIINYCLHLESDLGPVTVDEILGYDECERRLLCRAAGSVMINTETWSIVLNVLNAFPATAGTSQEDDGWGWLITPP